MVRSKGLMQIIVGLFLIVVSYLMDVKNKEPRWTIFVYVGGIFLAYGILKLILWFMFREKKSSEEDVKELKPEHIKAYKKNQGPTHTHHPTIVACHSCDTKHYSNANFCQMCGSRMK